MKPLTLEKIRMDLVRDDTAQSFFEPVWSRFENREAEFSLLLGLAGRLKGAESEARTLFLRGVSGSETRAAALQTPGANLILADWPSEALPQLIDYLTEQGVEFPGVVGDRSSVLSFIEAWMSRNHKIGRFELASAQSIYELRAVAQGELEPVGHFCQAEKTDSRAVAQFLSEFTKEALPANEHLSLDVAFERIKGTIESGNAYLWKDGGEAVSMAFKSRPTPRGYSINAVYTPKSFRGRGYATGVVRGLSQKILDEGKAFCTLYTDNANPTSNRIYQNIGYRKVAESAHYLFEKNS